jgi:hypothetical protein
MCRWTLGPIEHRCRVTVLVKPLTRKFFLGPDSGIATSYFFFSHVQVNVNVHVEICRIARRPMCAYMSVYPAAVKAAEELHARSKGYLTSVTPADPWPILGESYSCLSPCWESRSS